MRQPTRRQAIHAADARALENLLNDHTAKHSECAGGVTWWSFQGGWRKPAHEVHAAYRARGLDPITDLPEPPTYAVAFGRAINIVGAAVARLGVELKKAGKGPKGETRFAVAKIHRNGTVTLNHESTVVCPLDGTAPYVENGVDDCYGIATSVVAKTLDLFEVYAQDDMRTSFVTLVTRHAGLPCRGKPAVVYFALPQTLPILSTLKDAWTDLGVGKISIFRGYKDDPDSIEAVTNVLNEGLEAQINDLTAMADEYTATAKTRASTIAERMQEASEIRKKFGFLQTILGVSLESIEAKMINVENTLKAVITT